MIGLTLDGIDYEIHPHGPKTFRVYERKRKTLRRVPRARAEWVVQQAYLEAARRAAKEAA